MIEELNLLIEDYERKLFIIRKEISENIGKMKCSRLEVKAFCYRAFLTELNKLKNNL